MLKYKTSQKSVERESSRFMRAEGQAWRSEWSLLSISRMRLRREVVHWNSWKHSESCQKTFQF